MFTDRSLITAGYPPKVVFPDATGLRDNLAFDAQVKLSEIEDQLLSASSEEAISDDDIIRITHESAQFYVDWFGGNLSSALEYLEQSNVGISGEEQSRANSGSRKSPATLRSRFKSALLEECGAMSIGYDSLPLGEVERLLEERCDVLDQGLRASYDRFSTLSFSFGNPDVLRAEAGASASSLFSGLLERLGRLGDRPPESTRRGRFGARMTGAIEFSREQFDSESIKRLTHFKVPATADLLKDYVQMAMIQYAKLTFGEMPFVLDKGPQSDSLKLRDMFQARTDVDHATRPRFPLEAAVSLGNDFINEVIFGEDSEISRLLDNGGNKYQQSSRRYRKESTVRRSDGAWATGKPSEDNEGAAGATPFVDADKGQPDAEERLRRLDGTWFEYYITFNRLVNSLKLMADDRPQVQLLEKDFLKRLECKPVDEHGSPISLERILRRAMKDLHPEASHERPQNADQLFRLYAGVRERTINKNSQGVENYAYEE